MAVLINSQCLQRAHWLNDLTISLDRLFYFPYGVLSQFKIQLFANSLLDCLGYKGATAGRRVVVISPKLVWFLKMFELGAARGA